MPPGFEKSQSSSGHGLGSCLIQEVVDPCYMVLIKPNLCFISISCWDSILMRVCKAGGGDLCYARLFLQSFELCSSCLDLSRERMVGKPKSWGFSYVLWGDGGVVLVSETEGGSGQDPGGVRVLHPRWAPGEDRQL